MSKNWPHGNEAENKIALKLIPEKKNLLEI